MNKGRLAALVLLLSLLLSFAAVSLGSGQSCDITGSCGTKKKVILDHDGGVDDYLGLLLMLTKLDDWDLLGVIVTPADCYGEPSYNLTRKINRFVGYPDIRVALSEARPVNPFPHTFREDAFKINLFPIINEQEPLEYPEEKEGAAFMVDLLKASDEKVVLLVLGPLSTVAAALELDPSIESKIDRIVWMGGALDVPGNIVPVWNTAQDGTAEWNAFWDPPSVNKVLATSIPFHMIALDVTNRVPVSAAFMRAFSRDRRLFPLYDFAGLCYSLVAFREYYFWDVLATAYMLEPERFVVRTENIKTITKGRSQGRTVRASASEGGRPVVFVESVEVEDFRQSVLKSWQMQPKPHK